LTSNDLQQMQTTAIGLEEKKEKDGQNPLRTSKKKMLMSAKKEMVVNANWAE
jgi:hypothetical protein